MVVKKNKPKVSIVFKSILGIVILLIVFSLIVSMMGFRNFTDALLDQYSDGAFRTANTAVMEFDVSKIEDYAASGGTTEEYIVALESMERLCNSSGSTFIYVIRHDLSDYKHITFLFSTINENSDYTRYEFGFVRDTTNEEYMEKYRRLYEGKSDQELVIRDISRQTPILQLWFRLKMQMEKQRLFFAFSARWIILFMSGIHISGKYLL